MNSSELNLNEMEEVVGGKGGSPTPLPHKPGLAVYQIQKGDKLGTIARRFHTSVDFLMEVNITITNRNDITAGYYMYVPE